MSESLNHATSIVSWSMAIAKALEEYEIDSVRVFAEAGIDLHGAASPYSRFPVEGVQHVWRYASKHTDEAFGLRVSAFSNMK